MKIFTTRSEIRQYLQTLNNQSVGFVPTMGALHQGHISLISRAAEENDIVVCSIFVNPTQFNDPKDLENYPRPIEADMAKLQQADCDILFNPPIGEVYESNEHWHLDIGPLEHLLEGEFRPGHYQGVTQVVYKLLDIVKPDRLYLGQKDYQQFLVVSRMVELKKLPVKMIMCPIEREPSGLAMSSRNVHLSAGENQNALILSRTLTWLKEHFNDENIDAWQQKGWEMLRSNPAVQPEYLEIADGKTLFPATKDSESIVALTAARVGKTRLIDNVLIR